MKRGCGGCVCALWVLMLGCSPSGEDGSTTVVKPGEEKPTAVASGGSGGSNGGFFSSGGAPGDNFGDDIACVNGCAFSATPIFDANVSAADISAFEANAAFQAGSLCVVEPQLSTATTPGALFPNNWLRPRFRWTSGGGETLWEIRLHNESSPDDMRAYTRDTQWVLPNDVWKKIVGLTTPITVTIRGLGAGGALTGVSGDFAIAPVPAGGSMVFWATTSSLVTLDPLTNQTSSKLMGFGIGDEGVVPTLTAVQVQTTNIPGEDGASARGFYACGGATPRPTCTGPNDPNPACCVPTGFEFGKVECVGCHVSTPDGKAVLFTDNWPWDKVAASIEPATAGALPATVTPYAANLLKQPWLGMQALSPAFFSDTERILITSYGKRQDPVTKPYDPTAPTKHELAWFNLAAQDPTPLTPIPEEIPPDPPLPGQTDNIYQVQQLRNAAVGRAKDVAWGLITTFGEPLSAVTPTWTNLAENSRIAYVSTDISSTDGHPDWRANAADIRVVPYNNRAGGTSVPLAGASDPNFLEYYPEFSADDAFLAFARAPAPSVATRCVPQQDANGVVSTPCSVPLPQDLGENPDGPYYNRNGEIYIVPSQGGTPIRLAANDPVSCTGETARGSINSWPKWSPRREQKDGKTYYFLIFSSARAYPGAFHLPKARLTPAISDKSAQLYMAPIVVDDATQQVTTYPAIYLWNQNIVVDEAGQASIQNTSNLTPAWDDFSIPPVPPTLLPPPR
jgi:hypothetical protein